MTWVPNQPEAGRTHISCSKVIISTRASLVVHLPSCSAYTLRTRSRTDASYAVISWREGQHASSFGTSECQCVTVSGSSTQGSIPRSKMSANFAGSVSGSLKYLAR
jgi:hypothetical protein